MTAATDQCGDGASPRPSGAEPRFHTTTSPILSAYLGDEQPQRQPDHHRAAGQQSLLLQAQPAQKILDLIEALAQIFQLLAVQPSVFSTAEYAGSAEVLGIRFLPLSPPQNCMFEICWYACTILFRTCIIS